MKQILCILTWLVVPLVHADLDEELRSIDRQRKAEQEATKAILADYNFVRARAQAITDGVARLRAQRQKFPSDCEQRSSEHQLENCFSGLHVLIDDASMQLAEIDRMPANPTFQRLARAPEHQGFHLVVLINTARVGLDSLRGLALKLQQRIGQKLAQVRFRREWQALDEESSKLARTVRCRLKPKALSEKLARIQLLRQQGRKDAYAWIEADFLLSENHAVFAALRDSCGDGPEWRALGDRIDRLQSTRATPEDLAKVAQEMCATLSDQAPPELSEACAQKNYTSSVLFALRRLAQGVKP